MTVPELPPPVLSFSIEPSAAPEGGSVSASSIDFGNLSASTPKSGTQRLTVTTNASGGYSVTAAENRPMTSGTGTIPDVLGDDGSITEGVAGPWVRADTYGLGFAVAGADAAFSSGFRHFPNAAAAEPAGPVMGSSGPVTNSQCDVTCKVNVAPTQEVGVYTNTITYVITGNF